MTALPAKHLFTTEELSRMGEAGLFSEDDRIELVEGEIYEMSPLGERHAACVRKLTNLLARRLGSEAVVDVQNPLHLSRFSLPQPDLTLLRPREDFYGRGHPRPGDVLLLVEVADTSLDHDREVKVPLYGRHGVSEVWLVDPESRSVEVFTEPGAEGYGRRRVVSEREGYLSAEGLDLRLPLFALFD